jgi:hypothetical protein
MLADSVRRAARRGGISVSGVHRLRHTFCSHLAMRGAPARAIQELAGHHDLTTTQRYMHLSPAAIEGAIRLLDQHGPARAGHHAQGESGRERREILETVEAKSLSRQRRSGWMVDQNSGSSNPMISWLRNVEALRTST